MADFSGDWSSLPSELVRFIGTKIDAHSDYVRFRAVCVPWRSSSPATPTHLPCQLPWIFLPPHGSDDGDNRRSVIEVVSDKRHRLRLPGTLLRHHERCRGSSDGWIVMLEDSLSVVAINPLTGAEFNLPPLSKLPFVAQSDSSNVGQEYSLRPSLATLFMAGEFVCYKSGQDEWTRVPAGSSSLVQEAVYFQGMIYAVENNGSVTVCDVSSCDSPTVVAREEMLMGDWKNRADNSIHLVSAGDDLFLVCRFFLEDEEKTRDFKVYWLGSCGKRMFWESVNDLEGRALFLGREYCSVAVVASDFPGCKPDSVYFSDGDDLAIFSMEDGSIQRRFGVLSGSPDFIWFTPNPV